jgi:hypothetical protein
LGRNDREVDHGEEGEEVEVKGEESQASRSGTQAKARGREEERAAQDCCQKGEAEGPPGRG